MKLRERLEAWMIRRFFSKRGPCILQRRGYWQYRDAFGNLWALYPTKDPRVPFTIILEEEAGGIG